MKGFEPLKAEPESAVLPLHYIPILIEKMFECTQLSHFCQGYECLKARTLALAERDISL